jgi:hypothetical protein
MFRAHALKMVPDGQGHSHSRHVGIAVCFNREQFRAEFLKSTDIKDGINANSKRWEDLEPFQQVWILM